MTHRALRSDTSTAIVSLLALGIAINAACETEVEFGSPADDHGNSDHTDRRLDAALDGRLDIGPAAPCSWHSNGWTLRVDERAVAGLNSTGREGDPSFTADGLTLFFSSDRSGSYDKYRAVRANSGASFARVARLDAINSLDDNSEGRLAVSADGRIAAISADWVGAKGFADIWVASPLSGSDDLRRSDFELSETLNTEDFELDPWLSPDGLRIYFTRSRGQTTPLQFALFEARRDPAETHFGEPRQVTFFTQGDDNPTLTADQRLLVFSSRTSQTTDLWYALRDNATTGFGERKKVPGVNSGALETDPALTAGGCQIVFASNRNEGRINFFLARFVR